MANPKFGFLEQIHRLKLNIDGPNYSFNGRNFAYTFSVTLSNSCCLFIPALE